MPHPHDDIRIRHMLDYSREAVLLAEKRDRSDLEADRMLQLSLVRLVEIVGEAASRVSLDTRRRCPQIPWLQIAGMRNRLIHGYDFVDYDILWQTVTEDLRALVAALEPLVPSLPQDPESES
jgi:uncharacterized protein with HEPN domain